MSKTQLRNKDGRNIFKDLQEAKMHVAKLISLKLMHWSAYIIKISKLIHVEFVAIAIYKQQTWGESLSEAEWQTGEVTEKHLTLNRENENVVLS